MADIFFYTDPESIVDQMNDATTGEAFGPVSSTKFQITSRHKADTGGARAVAVFSGPIIAVDNGVNLTLIIQPDKKVNEITRINLPEIKYIIYKGIKRSSIIDDTNPLQVAPSTANKLTADIWTTQDKYNAAFGTAGNPGTKILRLNTDTIPDAEDHIETLFNPSFDPDFELHRVESGDYIGDFIDGSTDLFGIELVVNGIRSYITYEEVQNENFSIDTSSLSGTARIKNAKERILQFIDPTVFFGSLFPVKLETINTVTPDKFRGNVVYSKLLTKLFNKNRVYIDIRNEYNQSFNFLGVYRDDFMFSNGIDKPFSPVNSYSEWPILIIDNIAEAYNSEINNKFQTEISLKLPASTLEDDNKRPLILSYLDYFLIDDGKTDTIESYDKLIERKKNGDFYGEITYQLPLYFDPGLHTIQPVSTYVRLKVFRQKSILPPDSTIHRQENYIDSLILPFAQVKNNSSGMEIRTFEEDLYMGNEVSIDGATVNDENDPETDYISSVGYAFESQYVTFFTFANRRKKQSKRNFIRINSVEYSEYENFLNSINDRYSQDLSPIFGRIELDLPLLLGPDLYRFKKPLEAGLPNDFVDLSQDFSAISIKASSYEILKDSIDVDSPSYNGLDPNYDIHLILRNRQKATASLVDDPGDEHYYNTYEIGLRGFQEDVDGNILTAVEWNSGIILISYSENKEGTAKSMILIETGIILPEIATDYYLPFYRGTLNSTQQFDFINFRKRLKDGSSFRPNDDLYTYVLREDASFDNEEFNYKLYLDQPSGEIFFRDKDDNNLSFLPNYRVKGFFMEAATTFSIWNICSILSDPTKNNYIFDRLIKILLKQKIFDPTTIGLSPASPTPETEKNLMAIRARLFSPFHHFGERYSYPNPIIAVRSSLLMNKAFNKSNYYIISNYNVKFGDLNIVKSVFDTEGVIEKLIDVSSFKNEVFNLIRSSNYQPIIKVSDHVEYKTTTTGEVQFFKIPKKICNAGIIVNPVSVPYIDHLYQDQLSIDSRNYIEKIVGEICNDFVNVLKDLIERNAQCFYDVFTKNLVKKDSIQPKLRLIATGEGSTTTGITSAPNGPRILFQGSTGVGFNKAGKLGASLFTYQLEDNGDTKRVYSENLATIDKDITVAIHLTLFGLDGENAPSIVEIELNGPAVGGSNNKVLMRFVADPKFAEENRKLFPEHSLSTGTPTIPPYLVYSTVPKNCEQRVKLENHGTSLQLVSEPYTPEQEIVNADFKFIDASGNVAGEYYAKFNNLLIRKSPGYSITVRVMSGQSLGTPSIARLAFDKDMIFCDEIQVGLSIFELAPPSINQTPKELNIYAENLYPNDKFELQSLQKKSLIDEETIETYKMLANLIHDGTIGVENICVTLFGWNIGVQVPTASAGSNVIRDDRFVFGTGLPPLNNKVRPATLGWTEIAPTPDNVTTDLDKMFHPNDPNGNKTRLLEVPAWLNEDKMQSLRLSTAKALVVYESNVKANINIEINSYVSPVWSRLDRKVTEDYRHISGGLVEGMTEAERLILLNDHTLYNNGTTGSDAYIKFTPSEFKGSYNPILSCLRSFGIMEAIRDNIVYMATRATEEDPSVLSEPEAQAILSVVQTAIDQVVIEANEIIGYTQDITYDLFKKLKWYSSEEDEELYGPTS